MNTTKVYANMLAACSGKRLNAERLRRLCEARSVGEAFKMLGDLGFAYTDGMSVDSFVVGETNALISFIEETSPSEAVANALTARFKYNNAKLAYKSRFFSSPSDGFYNTPLDCKRIADGDYDETDRYMAKALRFLDEQKETSPQAIDIALTRAGYEYVLSCPVGAVKKYFRAEIDMKNILTAARMRRLGLTGDEFVAGGRVPIASLEEAIEADGFAECFENTEYAEYAERIERGEFKALWRAELDADDWLYYLTDDAVKSFTSYKPLLNYYTEALIELKTVKTALVCIKTDSRDEFYARIPDIYR